MKTAKLITMISLAALLLPAAVAHAGNFYLGLEVASSHIGSDDLSEQEIAAGAFDVDEVGAGGGMYLGYAFTDAFSLRFRVDGTEHETSDADTEFRLVGTTLEGVFKLRRDQALSPYIFGGLGGYLMRSQQDAIEFDTTGPAMVLGAGLYYMLGEHLGLDFSCTAAFINWEEQVARITLPDDSVIEGSGPVDGGGAAARFCLGMNWWF